MEMNELTETESKILAALEGEENEFSNRIRHLFLSLKRLNKSPSSRLYPDFSILWQEAQKEFNLEQIPANQERPLYKSKMAVAILGMGIFGGIWITWTFGKVLKSSGNDSFVAEELPLRISNLYGDAYLLNSDRSFRNSLRNVQSLHTGERVFVEENGFLDVKFSDLGAARILGGSEVLIHSVSHPVFGGKTVIHLISGTILTKVVALKKTSEFAIRTDLGEIRVRGTRFATSWTENSLKVAVTDGKIAFRKFSAPSQEISVFPMFQMEYREGGDLIQTPVSPSFRKALAELDYLGPKGLENSRSIRSEEDLFRLYSILERVEMEDGETITGVVYGMDEKYLYIRTVEEERRIPQSKILNVEKIR